MSSNCCSHNHEHHEHEKSNKSFIREYGKIILSGVMLAIGMVADHFSLLWEEDSYVRLIWYIIAYLPVGLPVIREAYESIKEKNFFSEFTLMSIATIGAFLIGEYPEGVAVMLFYCIGEIFQDKAVADAKKNIKGLIDDRPNRTTVVRGETTEVVDPKEVNLGEEIIIKPGERVALDGVLITEEATFDTSALTGESMPRTIRKGEKVLAGMILQDKLIHIKVTSSYDDSALSRILKMVEEAQSRKAPAELFIRKFARVYTPIVTLLSFLVLILPYFYSLIDSSFTYQFSDWCYRAIVFLVVSCPCALVVSIPLGYFGGIGTASRKGILFKGSSFLDLIANIKTFVFDKTGTITKGRFEISGWKSPLSKDVLLRYIASAEAMSTHPIAKAIVSQAKQEGVEIADVSNLEEISGKGLSCSLDSKTILVGNISLMEKFSVSIPEEVGRIEDTIVLLAVGGIFKGYITLSDTPKEDSIEAISLLRREGVENMFVLSGDRQSIVNKIIDKVGLTNGYGDLLPEDKVSWIEKLKQEYGSTAFVGDGINDAPALASSNLSIAMGGLGSDAAIETADVVIQDDSLLKLPTAIRIARATRRIVWENIYVAIGVKLVILILGALGIASLWAAVFADVGVTILAILNSIRLLITFK